MELGRPIFLSGLDPQASLTEVLPGVGPSTSMSGNMRVLIRENLVTPGLRQRLKVFRENATTRSSARDDIRAECLVPARDGIEVPFGTLDAAFGAFVVQAHEVPG